MKNRLKHELRLAFGEVLTSLGIVYASLSIFNLLTGGFDLRTSEFVNNLLLIYKQTFYAFFDFISLNLTVDDYVKDALMMYLVMGGITLRAITPASDWIVSFLKGHEVTKSRSREISLIAIPFAKKKIYIILFCLALWPIVFVRIFRTPIFWSNDAMAFKKKPGIYAPVFEIYSVEEKPKPIDFGKYGYDARNILWFQVSALVLLVAFLFLLNYIVQ